MNVKLKGPSGKGKKSIFAFLLLLVLSQVYGQEGIRFDVSASVDWLSARLNAQAGFDLAQAGIRLPAGRLMGEEILNEAYPRLLRPYLLSLRVDSDTTIRDLIERGELSLEDLDTLSLGAGKTPPSLSVDLSGMIGRYTVLMEKISALLTRHRRAIEPARPLHPAQTADYTGIIIIANEELPIHGRAVRALPEPCLFPKIWDTNMNLVYERQMKDPAAKEGALMIRYAETESIFRPTPSGLEGELAALLGPRPLRVLAREVFGSSPTDPVIDREDALKILSGENNRRLLYEGRVVLVLNGEKLK